MFLLALLSGWMALAPLAESRVALGSTEPRYSLAEILDAIRTVETGGHRNGGRDAVGDDGLALGPYQIHRAYFVDSGVAGRYEEVRNPDFSRRVVVAYWKRWCPAALESCEAEVLARVHNGGPAGARRSRTLAFWRKVERELLPATATD
jgi:hypothetical protein